MIDNCFLIDTGLSVGAAYALFESERKSWGNPLWGLYYLEIEPLMLLRRLLQDSPCQQVLPVKTLETSLVNSKSVRKNIYLLS